MESWSFSNLSFVISSHFFTCFFFFFLTSLTPKHQVHDYWNRGWMRAASSTAQQLIILTAHTFPSPYRKCLVCLNQTRLNFILVSWLICAGENTATSVHINRSETRRSSAESSRFHPELSELNPVCVLCHFSVDVKLSQKQKIWGNVIRSGEQKE